MEVSADNSYPDFRSPLPAPRSPFPVLVTSGSTVDSDGRTLDVPNQEPILLAEPNLWREEISSLLRKIGK